MLHIESELKRGQRLLFYSKKNRGGRAIVKILVVDDEMLARDELKYFIRENRKK